MKRISHRTVLMLILMGVLVAGVAFFTLRYFLHAGEWVVFPPVPTSTPAPTSPADG